MNIVKESSMILESSDSPYKKSNSIFSDIKYFFINKPEKSTFIKFQSNQRKHYNQLILDATGIGVGDYQMLNIHQIEIDTPVDYLFAELMKWNSDSCWWPNHIAKVQVLDDQLTRINVYLFGKLSLYSKKKQTKPPEFHLLRLFNFKLIRSSQNSKSGNNKLHYLLYECSGGYPIGVFSLFVRESLPENNEASKSQLFMMVSFNFYGIKFLSKIKLITKAWEMIHNRASSNSLTRIKNYCEFNYRNQLKE